MSLIERIAMCANPRGLHEHVPLKPDEPMPTTCFADCDCTPVEFVRADQLQRAVEAERARILSMLREWEAKTPGQHEFARDLRPSFYVERLSPGGR